jgi:signal-induced proliferation-associated 1 like protein 3
VSVGGWFAIGLLTSCIAAMAATTAMTTTPTDGSTGTHSVFTEWNNNEIMFHVSTMLPFNPLDKQQVC